MTFSSFLKIALKSDVRVFIVTFFDVRKQQNEFRHRNYLILTADKRIGRPNYESLIFFDDFFPVKAEMLLFPKMKKGGQKRDHQRLYFGLKNHDILKILKKFKKI